MINKQRIGKEELNELYVDPVTEVLKEGVAVRAESMEEMQSFYQGLIKRIDALLVEIAKNN